MTLFTTNFTYNRPATSYLALWQILGRERMISAMHDIQGTYGGGTITEQQLQDLFRAWLPVPSASCNARLDQFFPEWWDTAFPTGGTATTNKPKLSGPGLNGTGFVCAAVTPATPDREQRLVHGRRLHRLAGLRRVRLHEGRLRGRPGHGRGDDHPLVLRDDERGSHPVVGRRFGDGHARLARSGRLVHGERRLLHGRPAVSIQCSASDPVPGSGLDSDTCADVSAPAYTFTLGSHTLSATAEDVAGNVGSGSTTFTVSVTYASLQNLVARFSTDPAVTAGLNAKLAAASKAKTAAARNAQLSAFENQVRAQTGKALTAEQASLLISFAEALK